LKDQRGNDTHIKVSSKAFFGNAYARTLKYLHIIALRNMLRDLSNDLTKRANAVTDKSSAHLEWVPWARDLSICELPSSKMRATTIHIATCDIVLLTVFFSLGPNIYANILFNILTPLLFS